MCDPVSIAATASVATTLAQGYQAQQMGEYQNDVARYNARQTENEATRVRQKGTEEEIKQRNKVEQLVSRQRATLASSGVDINTGSAADLQEDALVMGEADALRIRSNYMDQAESMETQAELTREQGRMAERAGDNAFYTSILTGGGQVASSWYTPQSTNSVSNTSTLTTQGGKPITNTATLTYQ